MKDKVKASVSLDEGYGRVTVYCDSNKLNLYFDQYNDYRLTAKQARRLAKILNTFADRAEENA